MTTFAMPEPKPLIKVVLALSAIREGSVEVTTDTIAVKLGVAWRSEIPRSSIKVATKDPMRTISIGAHGWRGEWLVNTTTTGLVRLTIDPAGKGRCLGVPVTLRTLVVSLEDPDAFLAELGAPTG